MSIIVNRPIGGVQKYFVGQVIEVIFQNLVKNGQLLIQKYSVKRKVNRSKSFVGGQVMLCRPQTSNKFIQIPRLGQMVSITKRGKDYFWIRSFDSKQKSNLAFDYLKGGTYVTGSNHDMIMLNGADDTSFIRMTSLGVKDNNKYRKLILGGQFGTVNMFSSDVIDIRSNRLCNIYAVDINVASKKSLLLYGGTKINITGKQGVQISNKSGQSLQPMVLGQTLSKWREGLMKDIQNFLSTYTKAIGTGFAARGPAQGAGRAPFNGAANAALNTIFINSKKDLKKFLSSKNKVS